MVRPRCVTLREISQVFRHGWPTHRSDPKIGRGERGGTSIETPIDKIAFQHYSSYLACEEIGSFSSTAVLRSSGISRESCGKIGFEMGCSCSTPMAGWVLSPWSVSPYRRKRVCGA